MAANDWTRPMDALLRFLQFAFCLIALVSVSSAFVATQYYGYTSMLGSSPVTYTQLMTYTGTLYALWMLLVVGMLGWFASPGWLLTLLFDLAMFALLLVAAIVLLVSDYVQHCSVYGFMLRCRALNTAVIFSFLAMAAFLLTALMRWCFPSDDANGNGRAARGGGAGGAHEAETVPYQTQHTPTARCSPESPDRV